VGRGIGHVFIFPPAPVENSISLFDVKG